MFASRVQFPRVWPLGALAALLVAAEAAYMVMSRLDAVNGWRPVGTFLALFTFLFASYVAAHACARRAGSAALLPIAVGAVLFRLTLLPAGLPPAADVAADLRADLNGERVTYERFLLFDNDVWRYLWDGHVWTHGVNPFLQAPGTAALDSLADPEPGPLTDGRTVWSDVRDNVSHPHVPTIYPPLAQVLFRLSHALAPGSVLALKALVTLADLAAALFVALALRAAGRPATDVLLYAWNPLVVKVFAGSGHVDALLVAALAAMAWASACRSRDGVAIAFGVAVLAKLSPLILAPLVARRVGLRGLLLAAGVVAAGYAPFADAGPALFGGLAAFSRGWEFNAGPFAVVRAALASFVWDADAAARVASLALVGIAAATIAWCRGAPREGFAGAGAWTLGALLLLSPAVMPWYVTWLLPLAVVSGQHVWLALSGLAGFAFLVMVDGRERVAVLAAEYALFTATLVVAYRDRLRAALAFGGARMKWVKAVSFLAVLAALPASAAAQGSGSTGGAMPGSFDVVRQVDGTLVSVDAKGGVIVLDEKKTGKRATFRVDAKIKLKADKGSALGDRRDLTLGDFAAGHPVRIGFRTTDLAAVEMKLRKPDR